MGIYPHNRNFRERKPVIQNETLSCVIFIHIFARNDSISSQSSHYMALVFKSGPNIEHITFH